MKTLADVQKKSSAVVKIVKGPDTLRLMEMGFTPGSNVEVVRAAPMGFPIEVRVRGYLISLRKSEAEGIEIK